MALLFFWASYVALIFNEVAKATSLEWMNKACAFYADDGHLGFTFTDLSTFDQGLKFLGRVLNILGDLGMTVNLQKSAILLELKGKLSKGVRKQVVRRRLNRLTLQILGAHHTYIHDYLGVKISYKHALKQTMQQIGLVSSPLQTTALLVQKG